MKLRQYAFSSAIHLSNVLYMLNAAFCSFLRYGFCLHALSVSYHIIAVTSSAKTRPNTL